MSISRLKVKYGATVTTVNGEKRIKAKGPHQRVGVIGLKAKMTRAEKDAAVTTIGQMLEAFPRPDAQPIAIFREGEQINGGHS